LPEIPVSIGPRTSLIDDPATILGEGVAGMVRYMMGVLDREDRLEAGTGEWLGSIASDREALERSSRDSVLRALRMASEQRSFEVLSLLAESGHATMATLEESTGLDRPSLAERVADLTSAGLVTKSPEAGQVAITGAGRSLVELVETAVEAATRELVRTAP
jgi:DNA-binding HxlR family transcriptional regulator